MLGTDALRPLAAERALGRLPGLDVVPHQGHDRPTLDLVDLRAIDEGGDHMGELDRSRVVPTDALHHPLHGLERGDELLRDQDDLAPLDLVPFPLLHLDRAVALLGEVVPCAEGDRDGERDGGGGVVGPDDPVHRTLVGLADLPHELVAQHHGKARVLEDGARVDVAVAAVAGGQLRVRSRGVTVVDPQRLAESEDVLDLLLREDTVEVGRRLQELAQSHSDQWRFHGVAFRLVE